jgi:hypothetical protein
MEHTITTAFLLVVFAGILGGYSVAYLIASAL